MWRNLQPLSPQGMDGVAGGNGPGRPPRDEPTLKGSIPRVSKDPAPFDPFRVRILRVSLSGGVAPGYYLLPFQGSQDSAFFRNLLVLLR